MERGSRASPLPAAHPSPPLPPPQAFGAAGPGMEGPSSRVTLNVGGLRYRTCRRILAAFPGTKLGGLAEPGAAARFDYDAREFFFDRSGRLFEHVLRLCRSCHLHGATAAANCRAALRTELAFWGLSEARLPPAAGASSAWRPRRPSRAAPASKRTSVTCWSGSRAGRAAGLGVPGGAALLALRHGLCSRVTAVQCCCHHHPLCQRRPT